MRARTMPRWRMEANAFRSMAEVPASTRTALRTPRRRPVPRTIAGPGASPGRRSRPRPSPLRFIPWFCGLPCEPMTLEVREEGPIVAEGGCPACRLEVALFHEEDRPPRVAGKDVSAERAIEAAVRILKEARAPFVY